MERMNWLAPSLTSAFLDEYGVGIGAGRVESSVLLTELEYVVQAVQGDLDHFRVRQGQQVTQRRYDFKLNQIAYLIGRAARRGVHNGPGGLFARLVLALGQYFDELGENVGVEDGLDLLHVASRDVGNGPAGLFADRLFGRVEQGQEASEYVAVENDLSLRVVAGDDVADGS